MPRNRIVYQNWIVDLGYDPSLRNRTEIWHEGDTELISLDTPDAELIDTETVSHTDNMAIRIQQQVSRSLLCLTDEEREFITQFYFMGRTYKTISEKTGRAIYKLEALHKRALRKLKKELLPFVSKHWHITITKNQSNRNSCPICRSSYRNEIDQLIANRDKTKTWRPVLQILREQYGIIIRSPQILIGHEKYHAKQ